jgi:hypothetical protein
MDVIREVACESLSSRFPRGSNDYQPSETRPNIFKGPPQHHLLPGPAHLGPMDPTQYRYRYTNKQFYTHLDVFKNLQPDKAVNHQLQLHNMQRDFLELQRVVKNDQNKDSVFADNFMSYAKQRLSNFKQNRESQEISKNMSKTENENKKQI